jgi:flagellar biosynthetic protein FlhB
MTKEFDSQERTEQASTRQLEEARKRGQVPRSRELTTMLLLLAGSGGLYATSGRMMNGVASLFHESWSLPRLGITADQQLVEAFAQQAGRAMLAMAPFFGVMLCVALLAPLAIGGWNVSFSALEFKFERLDPVQGLGRVFGRRGAVETIKALAKILLIGGVATILLHGVLGEVVQLGSGDARSDIVASVQLIGRVFIIVAAVTAVIAALDAPYQLWDHGRQLRMSRQQLKEEMKEAEGRPEVRARIRRMQQEIATRRMMAEVLRADVVVTNPSHFAVALRYDAGRMRAPRVVAKGADLIAQRIRDVATQHGVCCFAAPPLARALYWSTKLNQEIPAGLYLAVAQLLAYVVQLRAGGQVRPPVDLPVPADLAR